MQIIAQGGIYMASIQIRVDDNIKMAADSLFGSLGLDTATAVRMFIAAALDNRGIPFEVKKNRPIELNDGPSDLF
jgi:DNA-damage-inducible protein J